MPERMWDLDVDILSLFASTIMFGDAICGCFTIEIIYTMY